jgi:SOS-response transcriptional repressor LexA
MPIRGRRNRRFVVEDCTVEYRKHSALPFLGGSPKVSALINLSVGGLQFVSDDLFEPGQRLDLKLMIPSAFRSLSVRGEVVWAKRIVDRDAYRTGVRFIEPSAEDISLLRSLEERYWSIADDRKHQLENLIAQRYPLHRERPAAEAAQAPEAPPPQRPAPAREPTAPAPVAPAAERPPPELAPEAPPAVEEAPVEEPAAPAETPAEEPKPEEPTPIPVYDLVAGVETKADAGLLLQGVPKYHVVLPGVTDRDCFALEVHDNTMRHTGAPSFDRGDIVVFSPNVPARSGDLAFVITREGGVFRQIFFDANNTVRLHPLNGWYPEQRYHRGEVQGLWKLVGKYENYLSK